MLASSSLFFEQSLYFLLDINIIMIINININIKKIEEGEEPVLNMVVIHASWLQAKIYRSLWTLVTKFQCYAHQNSRYKFLLPDITHPHHAWEPQVHD